MDPLYQSRPTSDGYFTIDDSTDHPIRLYYERRGNPNNPQKVIMLMGAMATTHHFDQAADYIAAADGGNTFEVLTFDYRWIGKSKIPGAVQPARLEAQSSTMLAEDALALLQHVWGGINSNPDLTEARDNISLHVHGASMGGMVAQKLALRLIPVPGAVSHLQFHLSSLTLSVTARSYGIFRYLPLGPGFYRFLLGWVLPSDPRAMYVDLLPKMFSPAFLAATHPSGKTFGELWLDRWVREGSEWFSFHDVDACAAQATVSGTHYLPDEEAEILRTSSAAIFVLVAENDAIMPPAGQRELGRILDATVRATPGGHLGDAHTFDEWCAFITQSMLDSSKRTAFKTNATDNSM